jgi:hypothetical protein
MKNNFSGFHVLGAIFCLFCLTAMASSLTSFPDRAMAQASGSMRSLSTGSRGYEVLNLQKLLNAAGYRVSEPGKETQYFGPLTLSAVKSFQVALGIACRDAANRSGCGIVGPKTWGALLRGSSANNTDGANGVAGSAPAGTKAEIAANAGGKAALKNDAILAVPKLINEVLGKSATPRGGVSPHLVCTIGSYPKNMLANMSVMIDSRIDASVADVAGSKSLWIERSQNIEGTYKRNPNVWTSKGDKPLDFTGVSAGKEDKISPNAYTFQQGGTLITPRDMVLAVHYGMPVGARVVFVNKENKSYVRKIVATKNVPNTDIMIARLDSELPDDIAYYPVIDMQDFIKKTYQTDNANPEFPLISFTQDGYPLVQAFQSFTNDYMNNRTYLASADRKSVDTGDGITELKYFNHISYAQAGGMGSLAYKNVRFTPARMLFDGLIRLGDSGQPNFVVLNNQPVFMAVHTQDSSGAMLGGYIDGINTALTELGGGYQVTVFDPSCFDSYAVNHAPSFGTKTGFLPETALAFSRDNYANRAMLDLETGYYVVPDGTDLTRAANRPLYRFSPTDADGNAMTLTVSDPAGLLVVDPATYSVYLKEKAKYYGYAIPGADYKDTYSFSITLSDNATPAAKVVLWDGFRVSPPAAVVTNPVVDPVKTPVPTPTPTPTVNPAIQLDTALQTPTPNTTTVVDKKMTITSTPLTYEKPTSAWFDVTFSWTTTYPIDRIMAQIIASDGTVKNVRSSATLAGAKSGNWNVTFGDFPGGSYTLKVCEWTLDLASRICDSKPFTVRQVVSSDEKKMTITSWNSTYQTAVAARFDVTFTWETTYPINRIMAQVIAADGTIKNVKGYTALNGAKSGNWSLIYDGYPAGSYTLKVCEWPVSDLEVRTCDSKPFTVKNLVTSAPNRSIETITRGQSNQAANAQGILKVLFDGFGSWLLR